MRKRNVWAITIGDVLPGKGMLLNKLEMRVYVFRFVFLL